MPYIPTFPFTLMQPSTNLDILRNFRDSLLDYSTEMLEEDGTSHQWDIFNLARACRNAIIETMGEHPDSVEANALMKEIFSALSDACNI